MDDFDYGYDVGMKEGKRLGALEEIEKMHKMFSEPYYIARINAYIERRLAELKGVKE